MTIYGIAVTKNNILEMNVYAIAVTKKSIA